jgi:alpha-beta hydrolase superfamily lysophospholipase
VHIAVTSRKPDSGGHGAWHGRWCWEPFFLDWFVDRGYEVAALDLRGHGDSEGRVKWASFSGYVDDVRQVAETFATPPVLVGHSMGGGVVQKYLGRHRAAGAVLLAPEPVHGVYQATWRVARRWRWAFIKANLVQRLGPIVEDPRRGRALFFREDDDRPEVAGWVDLLQDDSYLAYLSMMVTPPRSGRVRDPVYVIAAEADAVFSVAELAKTARAYGAEFDVVPGAAHDLMLDPEWERVAAAIDSWLGRHAL